jgi:uncharacterized protein (DUF2252 family)
METETMLDPLNIPAEGGRPAAVVQALNEWNDELSPEDRRAKYLRMAASPFVFYRGSNHLFWADFAADERLGRFGNAEDTRTWLQGDLHAYNFGSFDDAKGELVYQVNDFDEAIVADYQLDLWRMAVSLVLIARANGDLASNHQMEVIDAFSQTYLDSLKALRMDAGKGWRDVRPDSTRGRLRRFLDSVAAVYDREGMLDRWAPGKGKQRRLNLERKDQLQEVTSAEREELEEALDGYRKTLHKSRDFKLLDCARRLGAGTGSLGTARFYVLIHDRGDGCERILDVKQQGRPTGYAFLDPSMQADFDAKFPHPAQRHAKGYRALVRRSDPYLGWLRLSNGGHYSVRERSPFKEAFPAEVLDGRFPFAEQAEYWGQALAADHSRAKKGFADAVHKTLDKRDDDFRAVVREIAFSYADQV